MSIQSESIVETREIISNPKNVSFSLSHQPDTVVKVEGLYKKFCRHLKRSMLYGTVDVAKNMLGISYDSTILRKSEFWALEDINFELKRGETLGIMGANGSGKSTLLRILTGIYPPDKGKVTIKGRLGALIAVGAGFHPHMTGRENINLNGTILGMSKKEIAMNFDKIIDFAEIGDFIDAPVSTYSSGMYVRLGFSIAIHSNPEILIADEVLAVGDFMFQMKCFKEIQNLLKNGCTVILVSHSDFAIRSVCRQVAILHRNKLVDYGCTDDMIIKYRSIVINEKLTNDDKVEDTIFTKKVGNYVIGTAKIQGIEIRDKIGDFVRHNREERKKIKYSRNNRIKVTIDVDIYETIIKPRVGLYIRDVSKVELTYVCGASISYKNDESLLQLEKGRKQFCFELDISRLTPNVYNIIFGIGDCMVHTQLYDTIDETDRITFEIINSKELVESDVIINRPYFIPDYKLEIKELKE